MKTALTNFAHASVLLLALAMCACSKPEATIADHGGVQASKTSSVNHHAVQAAQHIPNIDARGQMADFARIWSGSVAVQEANGSASGGASDSASAVADLKPQQRIQDTAEFKRLQGMMNANEFERAKQLASTPELKAAVELEQQMHTEMLKAEQITATLDREKSKSKEP